VLQRLSIRWRSSPSPPPQQINFHDERTQLVGEPLTVRVPRDAKMGDVLEELRKRLPKEHAGKRLRLLEVLRSRIYKVCDADEDVSTFNESYWTLRAEPMPDEDVGAVEVGAGSGSSSEGEGGASDLLVHVYHVAPDRQEQQQQQLSTSSGGSGVKGSKKQQQADQQQQGEGDGGQLVPAVVPVLPFGEPFLLRIGRAETLASVKSRIRARLDVKADAFAKWRFCYVPSGRALPEYLGDAEVVADRFVGPGAAHALGAEAAFLGCEHEDKGSKRPSGHRAAYGFERPVKINS